MTDRRSFTISWIRVAGTPRASASTLTLIAARGLGDTIVQLIRLSLLELAGAGSAPTQRESLRERIKQLVERRLGDPSLNVEAIATALNCSRR